MGTHDLEALVLGTLNLEALVLETYNLEALVLGTHDLEALVLGTHDLEAHLGSCSQTLTVWYPLLFLCLVVADSVVKRSFRQVHSL